MRAVTWAVALLSALCWFSCTSAEEDRCRDRSCYPITGNLLIGRKKMLKASSTCGIPQRERFCIVSHLEEQTKCFHCDSTHEWKPQREPYRLSHRIENVVTEEYEDKTRNWWQSKNGMQNVTVQLDLEAEFHFTHLIMTFKSFRPAAMLIERSSDFGKTWKVYRYFAYDCASSFPGVPEGPPKKHTDVICTRAYSDVAPSTGGELVYKVISPHIATEDPFSKEISDLLKITNLRFNFTKLHTLGDDLLDYRKEIEEKYYYAVYEIVVRGSCSCYGHASRCITSDPNDPNAVQDRPDVVHGRCECMHNTEGLNCEKCRAFFNDLPWRPAVGEDTNECRQCECNRHATRCHFDRAVYEQSGFVSGGVCDDCAHNTQGKNCEQCKPFFYRDPRRPIYDQYVCLPCDCDKAGSLNNGICEGEEDPERGLVAGKCYCKTNVDGPRCDRCKNGFWNLTAENEDGCIACKCNLLGTYNNEGCDKYSGTCTCKRLVTGENCDQCLPEHYGLSEEPDGCRECDCDLGGAFDNSCDLAAGQCKCREGFSGRRCDTADSSMYCAELTHFTYEAEESQRTNNTEIKTMEWPQNPRELTWTGLGYVNVHEGSTLTFVVEDLEISQLYNIVIRYEGGKDDRAGWEDVKIMVVRPSDPDPNGPCAKYDTADDFPIARLHPGGRHVEIRPAICLEAKVRYEIKVEFVQKRIHAAPHERIGASILVDSLLLVPPNEELSIFKGDGRPQQHLTEYNRYQCRNLYLSLAPKEQISETCLRYVCPVAAAILNRTVDCDCDPTGSVSGICNVKGGQCECKANVVGRRCDQCALGTYGFGPSGCSRCDCDSVGSLNNQCDQQSGQCVCREKGIYGRQCNQCQPGFWGFPECRVCQCNDHANICDQSTGACIDCRDLTTGHYCDRCQDGYYGDPRLGVGRACKACPCPGGPTSGYQHADTCYLIDAANNTQDVRCNCNEGYKGERCGECATNYWGNPNEVGGTCEKCDCNGNIDFRVEDSCDAKTGECLKCLHNSEGSQCENCIEGYFGDAKSKSCQRCVCNELGTNSTFGSCDRVTGQCPCLSHVIGVQCDQCEENHYNMASGHGCAACDCDSNGVYEKPDGSGEPNLQCNLYDGRCHCKQGRGGRTCSECEDYFWGDPTKPDGCQRCECNPTGSATMQCHRNNGTCVCLPGSGGALCNECARGYTGQWPHCNPCGECFHQWDTIIQGLKDKVENLINTANNIEDTGVASAYDGDFEKMEKVLEETKKKLADADISKEHIEQMDKEVEKLKAQVANARGRLEAIENRVANATQAVDFAEKDYERLAKDLDKLDTQIKDLNEQATKIKEADVQGAYNVTKESAAKSMSAQRKTDAAVGRLAEAESEAQEAADLLDKNKEDFDKQFAENEAALAESEDNIRYLESSLPELNEGVCGAKSAPCDTLCGGPGDECGFCGGQSCAEGAVTKATQARSFALEADTKLNEKQHEAEKVLDMIRNSLRQTSAAKHDAELALQVARDAAASANASRYELDKIVDEMNDFLKDARSSPDQIRNLAQEVLEMKISLTPEQIKDLNTQIRESLTKINNIGDILAETKGNKTLASQLEAKAAAASLQAEAIKNTTELVKEALRVAEEAQIAASEAITYAEDKAQAAKTDVEAARNETKETEERAKTANESVSTLEQDMKKVKVQYLQISENAKSALDTVDKALQAAANAEQANKQMNKDLTRASDLLAARVEGNEGPQQRAQALREKAAKILYNAERHNEDIQALTKDASDVKLDDYEVLLAELQRRLERVTEDIHRRTEFYSTCDV
ncbi:hypothetical protein WR25_10914 [Diploscapter pachys]|uniref:Laminin subunit beta-1 n=1 Tax=Diploscapter pachys TaxID=2018661 RepID=A0A2A2K7V8_9BILA|nr:hypothetical protein WR25_10914 [Diploscapter pachys]